MNDENSKKLFNALSEDYDMGSYDKFVNDIQDEGKRRKLYDAIINDYDLPDFDSFSKQLGITGAPAGNAAGTAAGTVAPDTVRPDGNVFTESQLEAVENGAPVAAKPEFGTPEYANEIISDDMPDNPYVGMTRQQAVNEIGRKYRNEWYGQPGAYQNIEKELASYNIASPSDYGHITAAIRNRYVQDVARQRVEGILSNFKTVNGMTFDDIQGVLDSRATQQAINEDLRHLGLEQEDKDAYYQELEKQLEGVLVNKYGYLPATDGRGRVSQFASSLINGGASAHDDRILQREYEGMVAEQYEGAIQGAFDEAYENAAKTEADVMKSADATKSSSLGYSLMAAYESNKQRDPDTILKAILEKVSSPGLLITENQSMLDRALEDAAARHMDINEYIEKYIAPAIQKSIMREFQKEAIRREMPRDDFEYVMRGLSDDSIIGMIISSLVRTDSQMQYRDMANAQYGEGANIWLQGARMATGMASDFWLWGGWGKLGGAATRSLLNQRIMSLAATKHITREAATRILEEEARQYLSKGMFEQVMRHVPQSAITMGGAEATTEAVRGYTRNEEIGEILKNTFKAGMSGTATGIAFGVTGGASSRLTSQLTGVKRLAGKLAGLEVEAATLYTTEELQKMMSGEDAFENPFEGLFEANVKLGFIKASANPVESAEKLYDAMAHPVKSVKGMMKPDKKVLNDADVADLRDSFDGKGLVDALTTMRPIRHTDGSEREGYITEEKAAIAAQAYNDYMKNPDRPIDRKQRVARLLGGIVPPTGKEVRIDIDTTDGETILRTRDIDGQCVQELHFDNEEAAKAEAEKMSYDIDQNTTEALHQKIDMYDSFDRLDKGIEDVYQAAADKMQAGEELTDEEQTAVYLRQNKSRLLDITGKTDEGQPLSEEEQKLADIFERYFVRFVQEGRASKAFMRDYEHENGLEPGTLEWALRGHSREEMEKIQGKSLPETTGQEDNLISIGDDRFRTAEEAKMVDDYHQALREHIAEKESAGESAGTERTEGEADGEAGADGTGGNEPPVSPSTERTSEPERPAEKPATEVSGTERRPAGEAACTAAGEAAGTVRSERRQVAFDRGAEALKNPAGLAEVVYDRTLANTRLNVLLPDSDPILGHLRRDIIKAAEEGNDAEIDRLVEANAGSLNAQQKEAIELWRDAEETSRGVDESVVQEVQAYEQRRREELKEITNDEGNIVELQLRDGRRAYHLSGDMKNRYSGIMVKPDGGEPEMVPVEHTTVTGEARPMEEVLRGDVDAYGRELEQNLASLAEGTSFIPGNSYDVAIGNYLFTVEYEGNDAVGNMVFKEPDGKQSAFSPQDVQKFVQDATVMKIQAQLKQEKDAAMEMQRNERYSKGIVGYSEGKPDLSNKKTDARAAAEYLAASVSDGESDGHSEALKGVETEISNLREQRDYSEETVNRLSVKQELQGLSEQEEIALAESQQAIDEAADRRRKWGEIRQALMTDEERHKFEAEKQKDIKKAMDAAAEEPATKVTGTERSTERNVPTGKELLEKYEEQGDAENAVEAMRAELKSQYMNELYPKVSAVRDAFNDYRQGLIDKTPDELKQMATELKVLEAEENAMMKKSVALKNLASSLGRVYADRRKQQLSPHEYKMQQLEKETNKEKKLKLAKEAFKEDDEAFAVLNNLEPLDIYEHIADNLGPGSINWEGIQQGEHYARGLRDELGRDKVRGIGRESDTIGFNYFLAPEGQGKDIETIVHKIAEGSNYSTEDVKNALIDMLTSASKPTDISHRIIDDRIARAEEIYESNREREREAEEDAKREALDNEIMQKTGMTTEEYDAYISDLENRLAEQEGYKTSEEYFNQIVEDYEREQGIIGGGQAQGAMGVQGKEGEQGAAEGTGEEGAGAADVITVAKALTKPVTDKYHSLAPLKYISINDDVAIRQLCEEIGEDFETFKKELKEKKKQLAYSPVSKKIYIFAENLTEDYAEQGFFHENLHRGLHQYYGDSLRDIADAYWDASMSEASRKNKASIAEEYADRPDDIKEEYLVGTLAKNMTTGHVDRLIERLSPEHQEIIDNILQNIGYDRAKEAEERTAEGAAEANEDLSRQGDRNSGGVDNGEAAKRTAEEGSHSGGTETEGLANNEERGTQRGVESPIQGLDGYTEKDVTDMVRQHFANLVGEDGPEIVDVKVIGSRVNGDADDNSDLDVLLEYKGNMKEDGLFNMLNDEENRLTIEGIPVDINPITKGQSGTIAQFLERNKDYDKARDKQNVSFPARLAEAKSETNTNPTEEQKKAGNYKMGHISFGGYRMSIENPKGSTRSGKDQNGKAWSIEMQDTYGYIGKKYGTDGDHLDFFINDDADLDNWNGRVYVVDQKNEDGSFDEHKVMYGYPTFKAAKQAYERNYEAGWWDKHVQAMTGVTKDTFDKWLNDSDHKRKPFAEYSRTKNAETITDNVDQLLADVRDRAMKNVNELTNVTTTYKDGELEKRTIAELEQLKKKREKDASIARYSMKAFNIEEGSDKEHTLKMNEAKAKADIAAINEVLKRKKEERQAAIEQQEIGFAVTDRLNDMGYDVETDPREVRRMRKQAEKDRSEEGKMRHMQTSDGTVYGFVYRGKMYMDIRKIDGNLPLHEYAHPWCEAFRKMNPEGWKDVVKTMQTDKDTWDFVKQLNPDLKSDDDIAEEMIAKGTGEKGEQYAKAEYERMHGKDAGWKSKWNTIWQNIAKAIQDFWKQVGDYLHIKYETPEQVYDQVIRDFANSVNPKKKMEKWLKERDKSYLEAVKTGDEAKAKELFDAALRENVGSGIVPFVSAGGYRGKMQKLAHGIKSRDPKIIAEVADLMTPLIPKDAVLVPAPSHTGDATDMLDLAKAISERTGAPVADVLKSAERGSQYEAKNAGKPLAASEMGITVQGGLPDGKLPVVIDNVVDTGNTAEACVKALGKGIVASLADSKGRFKRVAALTSAEPVVTDKNGKVVKLSDRFELPQFMVEGSLFSDEDFEEPEPAETVAMPIMNAYGLNENSPIGKKLTELKEQAGKSALAGYSDNGMYVFPGEDGLTMTDIVSIKSKQFVTVDGMECVAIPEKDLSVVSAKLVAEGYKLAIIDKDAPAEEPATPAGEAAGTEAAGTVGTEPQDAVDEMLNEVERRKEAAKVRAEKEADKTEAEKTIDNYLKEQKGDSDETKIKKRATKAVLKLLKDNKVPYRLADEKEEKSMLKLFSMFNKEAVKNFARKVSIRSKAPHGHGRYAVYNMEDPFGVPMYAEKLSVAKEIQDYMNRTNGSSWEILDIGYADEAVEKPEELKKAANFQAMMGWHGSGALFTKFDSSHGYEGAGSMSFGWGTYLTSSRKVAEGYTELPGDIHYSYKGEEISRKNQTLIMAAEIMTDPTIKNSRDAEKFANRFRDKVVPGNEERLKLWDKVIEVLRNSQKSDFKTNERTPTLYKVDIPDDNGENYLDYKKPVGEELAKKIRDFVYDHVMTSENKGVYEGMDANVIREDIDRVLEPESNMAWMQRALETRGVTPKEFSQWLSKQGYVGIKYPAGTIMGGGNGATNYVIFNEKDAKIVDTIQFMVETQEEAPVFFSNAMKAVEGIKQEKATPEQWLKMIEKAGGLKAGEDKWMGLSEWLTQRKNAGHGGSVTKQEVMDFIRENQIEVEDVNYVEGMSKQAQEKLDAFNDEYAKEIDLLAEEYQTDLEDGTMDIDDIAEEAFNQMVDRYGDDFRSAFDINFNGRQSSLSPSIDLDDSMADAARYYLGADDTNEHPIHQTRLGYTTEELKNKKEIALTVPTIEPYNEDDEIHFGDAGAGRAIAWARFGETTTGMKGEGSSRTILDDIERRIGTTTDYSKMSDEDAAKRAFANYLWRGENANLAWMRNSEIPSDVGADRAENVVRLFDKLIADNKESQKVCVIDEIQSKRHQDARERGYESDNEDIKEEAKRIRSQMAENRKRYNELEDKELERRKILTQTAIDNGWMEEDGKYLKDNHVQDFANLADNDEVLSQIKMERLILERALSDLQFDLQDLANSAKDRVPNAPFEKNWHELAMKRMLRYAAENGYDKMAWTTGEQQAERYSLKEVVDKIDGTDNEEDRRITIYKPNGEIVLNVNPDGIITETSTVGLSGVDFDGKKLSDVVGKDLSARLMNKGYIEISDEGLTIGGEGMKGFYDQILPRFMEKYCKKWGVKPYMIDLPEIGQKMHVVDITPEMRESVMQGQPMFQAEKNGIMGWSDKTGVTMTKKGLNPNTPIHECNHLWDGWCQKENPELWKDIVEAMKSTAMWQEIKKNPNYRSIWDDDDKMASEVKSLLSGATSEEEFMKAAFKPGTSESIINKVKSVLKKFWESILRLFGKTTKTLGDEWKSVEAIRRMTLRDLMEGDFDKVLNVLQETDEVAPMNGEINDKSLVGLHNLSVDQLKRALKNGGLANPSVAVIDALKQTHNKYGDVTLVLPKSMVAAKTGKHKGVFGGDIYSPNYPQVYTRISDKNQEKLSKWVKDQAGDKGGRMGIFSQFMQNVEHGDYSGLEYIFLKEKGVDMSEIDGYVREGVDNFWVDYINKYTNPASFASDWNKDKEMREAITKHIQSSFIQDIMKYYINQEKERRYAAGETPKQVFDARQEIRLEAFKKAKEEVENDKLMQDENGNPDFDIVNEIFQKNFRLYHIRGDFDPSETRWNVGKYIRDHNLYEEYDQWARNLLEQYDPKEQLYNGTDNMGRQKFIANTLENASRLMRQQGLQGGDSFFAASMGGARAQLTPVFKTLAEIRKNKWRLGEEAFENAKEELEGEYSELAMLFDNDSSYFEGKYYDLIDAMKSGDAYKWAHKNGFDISEEDGKRIDAFAEALRNMPTGYFELKFERPVGLNEFAVAVVPDTTPYTVIDELKREGLDVRTYDSTGSEEERDASRKAVLMDAVGMRDDILFHIETDNNEVKPEPREISATDYQKNNAFIEHDQQFVDYISEKTGVSFKKNKNSNSWYGTKDGREIRISDHFNKRTDQDKYYFNEDADYIVAKINGVNPFEHLSQGDTIHHIVPKIGDVEFISYNKDKGFVEVRLSDGTIHKYDEEKFASPENFKFQKATGDVEVPNEYDVAVRDKLIDDYLKPAGIGFYSDAEAEKILEEGKGGLKLSKEIGEKEVKNVIVDTSMTPLPNNRQEAIDAVSKLARPFINRDQAKEIKVFNQAVKHTAMQDHDRSDVRCLGVIDKIIKFAVKIGNESPAEDEKGHTNEVEIYYCPVNIDGIQYSARLVVKRYENRGLVLDDYQLYDLSAKENKTDAVTRATGQNALTSPSASVSGYKVKEIIHISQENDQKLLGITDKNGLQFFKTSDGEVYGFALNGKIGIDRRTAKADTPIHEYGHLWAAALRKVNPEEWKNVVKLMKGVKDIWDAVKRDYSELKTEDDIAEEVLTQYSGSRGRQRFYEERERVLNDQSISGDEKVRLFTIFENVKRALHAFWGRVADFLHIHYTSSEQVADQVLGDLLSGINPEREAKKYASETGRIKAKAEQDGSFMKAPDGSRTKLSEKGWLAARTEGFKKWIGGDWEALSGKTAEHTVDESLRNKLDRNGEPQEKYVQGYLERPRKPGKPKKKDSENLTDYFNRLTLYNEAIKYWPETEEQWKAVVYRHDGSALPDETAIHEKWMQKYKDDLAKWKEDNALAPDAEAPVEKPVAGDADPLDFTKTMADWRRNETLWKTAPDKKDYEREAEAEVYSMLAALELKHHPMSYSARMRQMGASLKQISEAVLTQKRYDQATVQSVVDFAKNFMSLGFGDNIGRGDMERILTSVKRAVGARSIKDSVDNIMEHLVRNHLRNLSNFMEKMTSIKDKRLNPTGVEVQGELDLEGQRAINEFRRLRAARMTPEDINSRLNELAEKITNAPENRSQWEAEYDGAHAALTYAEGIAANKKACADAEDAIRDAEKGYGRSGRSYAAQQELLTSLHRVLSDLLFERIDLYGQLFDELGGILGESRERAKEFREREKARVFNIHRLAAIDMAGKDANETHPQGWKQSLNNSAVMRLPLSSLGTFEQLMKQFGSRHPNGEGALYNHFMRGFVDATNAEQVGLENAKAMLDAKASEVFGKKMQWSHLYYLERSMPTMDVTWRDSEGNQHTYTLRQGNMLAVYMWNKMHDGQMKLRKMDIDDNDVMRITEHIDPKLIELADWVQQEFLPTLRTKYNKVHEQEFGASMAEIKNYFPLRIIKDSIQKNDDLTADPNMDSVLPSTTTGSIIKRTVNAKPLDILNTDALSLIIEHIEEMEKWAAFTHWNKDVNTLLSYNRFKNQVKNMDTIYGSGDELWDAFRSACQLAAGSYRPKHGKADKAMTVIASGVTGAKIAFHPYTAVKQLLSAPAFLYDADPGKFAAYFCNPKNFFHDNIVWGMENLPMLRKRWHSRDMGDTRLTDKTGFGYWHTQVNKWVAQYGMAPNAMVDVMTCAAGARAVYETRLSNYKKQGLDDARAKEKALQDAALAYNMTQQSSEGAFVTPIQKDRTLFANTWTLFRNSSMSYTRQSVDAIRNLKRMYSNRQDMLYSLERTFREEEGLSEEQAKVAARAEFKRALWKNMAKLAVCAFILPWFWELGSKVPYLIFGDDDELKKRMLGDVTRKELVIGPMEGLVFGNALNTLWGVASNHEVMDSLSKTTVWKAVSDADVQPLPLFGDMGTMLEKLGYDQAAAIQDMVNIACQMATGVNPQTLTDPIMAAIDASRGDLAKAKEIELFLMRVMMVPTESAQNIYLDELGMDAKKAQSMTYDELAERYAKYKFGKSAPMFGWVYSDEAESKRMESYMKRFDKAAQDRIHIKDDESLRQQFERSESQKERKLIGKEVAGREGSEDYYVKNPGSTEVSKQRRSYYLMNRSWQDILEDIELERINREAKANNDSDKLRAVKAARKRIYAAINSLSVDKDAWNDLREARKEAIQSLK